MSAELPLHALPESTPLCTPPGGGPPPQQQLLAAVRGGQLQLVSQLADRDDTDLNHFYEYPDNCSLLQAAVDGGHVDVVAALLRHRADPNVWNPVQKTSPLHTAVQKRSADCVNLLLDHGADVATKNGKGRTPLHVLAERAGDKEADAVIVSALLSRPSVDVNARDRAGCSALYLAAVSGADITARYLLSNGADTDVSVDGKSAEDLLLERGISTTADPKLAVTALTGRSAANVLYEALQAEDLARFTSTLHQNSGNRRVVDVCHGNMTCLQYACDNGLTEFVTPLLQHGAEADAANPSNGWTPLHYAAARGYHAILKQLVHHEPAPRDVPDVGGDTLLHKLVRAEYPAVKNVERSDYARCLRDLAANSGEIRLDVNAQDALGSTPLHYAVARGDTNAIEALLRLGANIGIKNRWGETPVRGLPADALQKYLDECVTCNERPVTDAQFEIELCYSFLAPRRRRTKTEPEVKEPLPETESLWYMAQSKRHRHLLKHPVISSFLDLKWQRVRGSFLINMALYTLFVGFVTTFVFLNADRSAALSRPTRQAEDNGNIPSTSTANEEGVSGGFQMIYYVTAAMVVVLAFREMFQLLVAPRRYLFTLENYVEILMLVMASLLLFVDLDDADTRRYSALVVLLSWAEFFMLMGRLPLFSIYVTMFTTVLERFVKFLLWYLVLILAFALSFYLLFRGDDAFPDPGTSLIKTLVMTIGEMDYGDLPIADHKPVSQLVFLAFLFLITIVLMNLLNGLAVADTGEIWEQAQIYGYVGRVELISYIESMLLGDPFHFLSNYPPFKWLRWVPDCAPCSCLERFSPLQSLRRWLGDNTLLFFNALPTKNLVVFPNQRDWQLDPRTCHSSFSLDRQIIDDAKSLLIQLRAPPDDVAQRLQQLEKKMDRLLAGLCPPQTEVAQE